LKRTYSENFAGAPLNAGNRCRSAFALLFITCFSGLESRNLKDLDLIPSSPCGAMRAGASPGEAQAIRAGGRPASAIPGARCPISSRPAAERTGAVRICSTASLVCCSLSRGPAARGEIAPAEGARIARRIRNYAAQRRSRSDRMIASARTRWSMSAALCNGEGVRRSRSVPRGTVG
jgi:hypothetical protein